MSEQDILKVVEYTYQQVVDTLLFLSDEMEMGYIPMKDGVAAIRMAAGVLSLTKELIN